MTDHVGSTGAHAGGPGGVAPGVGAATRGGATHAARPGRVRHAEPAGALSGGGTSGPVGGLGRACSTIAPLSRRALAVGGTCAARGGGRAIVGGARGGRRLAATARAVARAPGCHRAGRAAGAGSTAGAGGGELARLFLTVALAGTDATAGATGSRRRSAAARITGDQAAGALRPCLLAGGALVGAVRGAAIPVGAVVRGALAGGGAGVSVRLGGRAGAAGPVAIGASRRRGAIGVQSARAQAIGARTSLGTGRGLHRGAAAGPVAPRRPRPGRARAALRPARRLGRWIGTHLPQHAVAGPATDARAAALGTRPVWLRLGLDETAGAHLHGHVTRLALARAGVVATGSVDAMAAGALCRLRAGGAVGGARRAPRSCRSSSRAGGAAAVRAATPAGCRAAAAAAASARGHAAASRGGSPRAGRNVGGLWRGVDGAGVRRHGGVGRTAAPITTRARVAAPRGCPPATVRAQGAAKTAASISGEGEPRCGHPGGPDHQDSRAAGGRVRCEVHPRSRRAAPRRKHRRIFHLRRAVPGCQMVVTAERDDRPGRRRARDARYTTMAALTTSTAARGTLGRRRIS
jgi:hypothetical protein